MSELGFVRVALMFLLTIELARALPWPRGWTQKRPLSCDVCMSSWCTIAAGLLGADLWSVMAGGGLCLLVLVLVITPRRSPPSWDDV